MGKADMRRLSVLFACAALIAPHMVDASPHSDWVAAVAAVDADCEAAHSPTKAQLFDCYNREERVPWAQYAPEALIYFDEWARQRARIGAAFDAGQLSPDEARSEMTAHKAVLDSRISTLAQEEAANQQRADEARRAQQERNDRAWAAIGYFAQAQSQAAQARTQAAQRAAEQLRNQTQHTRCQYVFGQLDCTTTPY